jgi:hypothetical protein
MGGKRSGVRSFHGSGSLPLPPGHQSSLAGGVGVTISPGPPLAPDLRRAFDGDRSGCGDSEDNLVFLDRQDGQADAAGKHECFANPERMIVHGCPSVWPDEFPRC